MIQAEVIPSEHGWTWFRQQDSSHLIEHPDFDERIRKWASESLMCRHNHISTSSHLEGIHTMSGTLTVKLTDEPHDSWLLHYYIAGDKLVTVGDMSWLVHQVEPEEWDRHIASLSRPVEGFLFIMNSFIRVLFARMDEIEVDLTDIEERMRKSNGSRLLREIIDLRNQLTRWNLHTVALREIEYGVEETFPEIIDHSETYRILNIYLKRIRMLQQNYEHEIDSLLKVDDNIANYRSNTIMKTLTVFTVLLTPMTALGAIWGMNFKNMPELEWKWGYAGALGLIFGLTLVTYLWLRSTGLTGDILNMDMSRDKNKDLRK
ncbi:CorA family divalent cation transporter [Paenibacillus shenyangensis]|uniref:CorA family divalent cation transporter n=1 Tax=Paenibacillus sp. A9 TaxID=1284352 RepID=UPI000364185C|nr:CorA family divalent cation transporter [Paenibacillus sp. A9]